MSTDNAYVRGQTTLISPRVGGYVSEVLVNDFARVEKGQPLVRIDDAPYAAKVAQAEANLAAQNANLGKMSHSRTSADAGAKARESAIRNAETQLRLAQANMKRLNSVKGSEGIAQREYEQAQSALEQAQAAYTQAQAMYTVAQQDVLSVENGREGLTAAADAARATVDLAKQELAHTVVYAPVSGRLGEVAVKQGQLVSAGSQLMFVVPDRRWIIANFKEADTAAIRTGQKASVAVDALGGKRFSGKVSEIAPYHRRRIQPDTRRQRHGQLCQNRPTHCR
nr:HlyD family secretion protein [Conchiformibius kuhniae]